jgi:hypothetical protein
VSSSATSTDAAQAESVASKVRRQNKVGKEKLEREEQEMREPRTSDSAERLEDRSEASPASRIVNIIFEYYNYFYQFPTKRLVAQPKITAQTDESTAAQLATSLGHSSPLAVQLNPVPTASPTTTGNATDQSTSKIEVDLSDYCF